jgi:molybdopterin converting factor subunit 1
MQVKVEFFSWFKDLTGCAGLTETLPSGSTVSELMAALSARFPKLTAVQHSTLVAVGVDYQDRHYVLREGDEVSLFPPVQGG